MGAVNSAGDGAWSATATGTPQSPAAPGRVPHTIGGGSDGSIFVSWVSPADDGGANITSYDLRYIRSDADATIDGNWTILSAVTRVASFYYVQGLTNAGSSTTCSCEQSTPSALAPGSFDCPIHSP